MLAMFMGRDSSTVQKVPIKESVFALRCHGANPPRFCPAFLRMPLQSGDQTDGPNRRGSPRERPDKCREVATAGLRSSNRAHLHLQQSWLPMEFGRLSVHEGSRCRQSARDDNKRFFGLGDEQRNLFHLCLAKIVTELYRRIRWLR